MRAVAITTLAVAAALGLSACGFGEEGITVSKDSPDYEGCALRCQLRRLPHLTRPGLSEPATAGPGTRVRTSTSGQTYEDALTQSRTVDSPARSCRRTSWSGKKPSKVARFVAEYAGSDAGEAGAEVYLAEEDASSPQDEPIPTDGQ